MNKLYFKVARCAEQSFFEQSASAYHSDSTAYFNSITAKNKTAYRQSSSGFMLFDAILCELGADRSGIIIARDENGRPYAQGADLDFSISHSGNICACAVFFGGSVGCDIQELVTSPEEKLVHNARYFMNSDELSQLKMQDVREFYTACWSKKEAYLKASGLGNDSDLTALETSDAEFTQKRLDIDKKIYFLTICTKKYR